MSSRSIKEKETFQCTPQGQLFADKFNDANNRRKRKPKNKQEEDKDKTPKRAKIVLLDKTKEYSNYLNSRKGKGNCKELSKKQPAIRKRKQRLFASPDTRKSLRGEGNIKRNKRIREGRPAKTQNVARRLEFQKPVLPPAQTVRNENMPLGSEGQVEEATYNLNSHSGQAALSKQVCKIKK